jgi:hypothetical protein
MTTDEIDAMVGRYLSVKMDGTEVALATPGQTCDDLEGTEWRLQDQLETAEMDLKYNRFAVIRKDALQLLGVTSVDEDSATAARRAGIPDGDADELGGWSKSGSQRSRTYAADHTIPAKAAPIERLNFICVKRNVETIQHDECRR